MHFQFLLTALRYNDASGHCSYVRSCQTKKGFLGSLLGGGSNGVDLDLGCMFEFKDGSKGIVQALGNHFGQLDRSPYIFLDGDDRTGSVSLGENLYINGKHWDQIKRVMVFAFIYEGVAGK